MNNKKDDLSDQPAPSVSRRDILGAAAVAAGGAAVISAATSAGPAIAAAAPAAKPEAIQFPTTARGFNQPMRFEANVYDCEIIGKIPSDLSGAYVRVGPEFYFPQLLPGPNQSVDGDGFINAYRIKHGRVDYKSRWVKTERWKNDRKAGRQLYGSYRNPYTDDPSIRAETIAKPYLRTVANTHIIHNGGKLFACKEDGPAYQIDAKTLDTIGPYNFGGKYDSQTFSAHNKIDPLTGDMIAYGYEATGLCSNDLWAYVIDKRGSVRHSWKCKVPQVSMIHDMALTEKHMIFPFGPYVTSLDWLKAGNPHWAWDGSKPSMIGILPRNGDAKDIRWFTGPARAMVHIVNARTDGDMVTLYACFVDGPFPYFPYFGAVDGKPLPQGGPAKLRKYTFDLGSKADTWKEEVMWDTAVGDIGRIDDRFAGLSDSRYAYLSTNDASKTGPATPRGAAAYARYDLRTGKTNLYSQGDPGLGECAFVPKKGAKSEGEGYLIGVANNVQEMRSELVIADAQNLEAGDIARVILPFRSSGLHGSWINDEDVDFG